MARRPRVAPPRRSVRGRDGVGATALTGLAVYGLGRLAPWWLLLPLGAVAALACAAGLTIRETRSKDA